MKTIYTAGCIAALMFLGSCEEMGFVMKDQEGSGEFSKNSILLDIRDNTETVYNAPSTRAGSELDDFKILFFKNDGAAPEKYYTYSAMPDVVTLPVGRYKVTATKGTDVEADWESPYYVGESDAFYIMRDSITTDVNPIVCRLQNVKVTVEFDPTLSASMSPESYVEVKVGDNAGLQFTKDKEGVAGHFKHTDGVSLVASFNGVVEGEPTVENKSFEEVKKGHHYKIKFKLHSQDGGHTGSADANVNVDASVTTVDLEYNVVVGEDVDLGDAERPQEGGNEEPPVTPPGDENTPPTIVAQAPINLDGVNLIEDDMDCVLNITSTAEGGFTKFICTIDSELLDADELAGMGLASELDMINPGEMRGVLENLGLLEPGKELKGASDAKFDISQFMSLLGGLGEGEHKFILTVADANGETVKTLILKKL